MLSYYHSIIRFHLTGCPSRNAVPPWYNANSAVRCLWRLSPTTTSSGLSDRPTVESCSIVRNWNAHTKSDSLCLTLLVIDSLWTTFARNMVVLSVDSSSNKARSPLLISYTVSGVPLLYIRQTCQLFPEIRHLRRSIIHHGHVSDVDCDSSVDGHMVFRCLVYIDHAHITVRRVTFASHCHFDSFARIRTVAQVHGSSILYGVGACL